MTSKVLIESNAYHDSVTLMSLSSKINRMDGVEHTRCFDGNRNEQRVARKHWSANG